MITPLADHATDMKGKGCKAMSGNCCCKKKVQLGENPLEMLSDLSGWVSVDRKPFCRDCLALFTEEDWDWCAQPPVALRLSEIAGLMPAEVEPI
jgi:hypothetical protein